MEKITKKYISKNGNLIQVDTNKRGNVYPGEVEGVDYLVCKECGEILRCSLSYHIKVKHNMTGKEYTNKWGEKVTISRKRRKIRLSISKSMDKIENDNDKSYQLKELLIDLIYAKENKLNVYPFINKIEQFLENTRVGECIICPECGKKLHSLYYHMEHIHNMTLEQVREKYPTLNMYSVKNKSEIKEEKIEIEQKPKLVFFKLKRKRMSELRKRFIHSK